MPQDLEQLNNTDELSQYIDTKQKELQEAIRARDVVDQERFEFEIKILNLQRELIDLKTRKAELSKSLGKSKAVCMSLNLEIKRATARFWSVRNC